MVVMIMTINRFTSFLIKISKEKQLFMLEFQHQNKKKDLETQIELLKNFCFQNGLQINEVYKDVASGISFEKRNDFFKMLDEVISNKVEKIIITYKDRLSRVGFDLFSHLFKKFGTEIVVISEIGSPKLDSQEIFEEIISMLHCYSMKLYSKRKHKLIQELIHE